MPFLVMELLEGVDLMQLLSERGRLTSGEVVALLHQAAHAIDRTHAAGVVHRDLKPQNLFLTHRDDGTPRLKVLDFGIARLVVNADESTAILGTPLYMPPEQFLGEGSIGPAADIYALAQVAFTLLVGTAYWTKEQRQASNTFALLIKISKGPAEPTGIRAADYGVELPPAFEAWFARATAIDPTARHPSAMTLVKELAAALGEPLDAGPPVGLLAAALPQKGIQNNPSPARRDLKWVFRLGMAAGLGLMAWVSYAQLATRRSLVTLTAEGFFPRSCRDIRVKNTALPSGTYSIWVGDGPGESVPVYCHDMEGIPREYLTLPPPSESNGRRTNCSHIGEGPNTGVGGVTTCFSKLRFLPDKLAIDVTDYTFSESHGEAHLGKIPIKQTPYADAFDCVAEKSTTGWAIIDLSATPFSMSSQQFVLYGFRPAGNAVVHGFEQRAELQGGGFCGGIGLRRENAFPGESGAWHVEPLRLAWASRLYVSSGQLLSESGGLGSERFQHWKLVNNTTPETTVALTTHERELYALIRTDGYRLLRLRADGQIVGTQWTTIGRGGPLTGAVAMASHQGQLYMVAGGQLFTIGLPQLERVEAGAAPHVTALAAHKGKLYALADGALWLCQHEDKQSPQTCTRWSAVGEAPDIKTLTSHQGYLYGASRDQLLQRADVDAGEAPSGWRPVGRFSPDMGAIVAMTSAMP